PVLAGLPGKRSLAPGVIVSALASYGAWTCRRKLRRRFALWLAVSLCSVLLLSFGSRWSIGGVRPYESIVERYWPGFAHVRSPYRFAALVQLFALVFAALGLDALRERLTAARASLPLMAAASLALLEVVPFGAPLAPFPTQALRAPWLEYLKQNPGGALVMIPPALSGKAAAFEPTTVAMLQSLRHGHPLLNGYSGFFPKQADELDGLRQFPSAYSRRLLLRLHPRYAVIDKRWLATRPHAELTPLTLVFDGAEQAVYRVP
ncbi:MAG TPA: hypothetical protein VJR89_28725, partial [Polyangiales bacterium]|nr:hypothetical protein [Polyangiales bacterium]